MSRTLTSRGLAVVFASLAVVGVSAAPAFAGGRHSDHHRHSRVFTGTWQDAGPTIDTITPNADGTAATVTMHGSTVTQGDFAGTSTYTMTANYDVATAVSDGTVRETYTATLGRRGRGHVTLVEHAHVASNGDTVVTGRMVNGDGVFRNARGYARFTGTSEPVPADPNTTSGNRVSGTYVMRIDLDR